MSKAVKIVSDSTLDLPEELVQQFGIEIVPLTVNFANEFFEDRLGLSSQEFFQRLVAADELPTTSQPSVGMFKEKYLELAAEAEVIISIHLADQLSGTYKAAYAAAQQVEQETETGIVVIDSCSASLGLGMLVLHAARLVENGVDLVELKAELEKRIASTTVFFTVDTLEYLEKGGRIGKASAFLGSLLNIKPILKLDEQGVVDSHSKVRGQKKALKKLRVLTKQALAEREVEAAPSLGIIHGNNLAGAEELKEQVADLADWKEIVISEISPVIGTHTGPGVLGLVVF
ncbi:DegV family protein [Fuchsiella alkaliacetigena]|uniref:DegV family protein n=1 Tax=Fuchsiella alkaliacetigena TaxID=957042 RepID=UPI00200B4C3F|nr:DegV family protein [Fuchsiella alkaliacetigena]MCK8823602.1 DegV family protein [Fuchsiella alkaliacetigena]